MDKTEETLPQNSDTQIILKAISDLNERFTDLNERFTDLNERFNNFEKFVNNQFEAIRRGLVDNSAASDRLQSSFHASRSDIYELRADVKELTEEVRQGKLALK